jgi:hypothetical protein
MDQRSAARLKLFEHFSTLHLFAAWNEPTFFSMLHLYDSSPYSIKSQTIRLKATGALSVADIKSLVWGLWGEDALAFVYFVPANLSALHLVVADQDVHVASTKVTGALPYEVFTRSDKNYNEFIGIYSDQPRIFPNSVYLQLTTPLDDDDPSSVAILPRRSR